MSRGNQLLENPLTTYEANAFYEVAPNIILTNHIICPNMVFINQKVWDNMSAHDQEVVQNAIASAIEWQDQEIVKAEQSLAQSLAADHGCTVIEPDDTIREATIPFIKLLVEDWDLIQGMA